jgi:hypothetical protein
VKDDGLEAFVGNSMHGDVEVFDVPIEVVDEDMDSAWADWALVLRAEVDFGSERRVVLCDVVLELSKAVFLLGGVGFALTHFNKRLTTNQVSRTMYSNSDFYD